MSLAPISGNFQANSTLPCINHILFHFTKVSQAFSVSSKYIVLICNRMYHLSLQGFPLFIFNTFKSLSDKVFFCLHYSCWKWNEKKFTPNKFCSFIVISFFLHRKHFPHFIAQNWPDETVTCLDESFPAVPVGCYPLIQYHKCGAVLQSVDYE